KTFPSTLQLTGGNLNWTDRTGRYFLVIYGNFAHLWDKQTDTIYAGGIDLTSANPDSGNGYIALTPDGNYIVSAAQGGDTDHYSYPVNHTTKSISSSGTFFWSLCGQHGALDSASNGKNYFVTFNCTDEPAIYRVDITLPQSASNIAKQKADNLKLFDTGWPDDGHHSCASKRPNQDWCYVSISSHDDMFNNMGTWRPYKQEIVVANVLTGEVRRLAHHRSRSINCPTCSFRGYYYNPRVSISWDGTKAAWASNYNYDAGSTEYADIYTLEMPALLA